MEYYEYNVLDIRTFKDAIIFVLEDVKNKNENKKTRSRIVFDTKTQYLYLDNKRCNNVSEILKQKLSVIIKGDKIRVLTKIRIFNGREHLHYTAIEII